jgi:hypothetical protein
MPSGSQIQFNSQNQPQQNIVPPPPGNTIFGASGPSVSSPTILKSICGATTVSRTATYLSLYSGGGDNEANTYLGADVVMFINLDEKPVGKDKSGNKIPNPFATNLDAYKQKLIPFFNYYQNHPKKDKIFMCCENEPTTDSFHSGPMSDYLKMLRVFGDLCNQYGFKWCDGGVHVDTVLGADSQVGEGKAVDVAQLLAGYATMPDMYAVNMHTSNGTQTSYDYTRTVKAVDKVFKLTGHKVVSNEWHAQDTNNAQIITDVLVNMAKGWAKAIPLVEYAVYISGTSDKNKVLNSGNSITPFGTAYNNFINSQ